MGLLDSFNDPQSMGLLNAAAQILQGSGQTRQPFGLGQAFGVGAQGYMQGNAAGMAQQQQRAEEEQQRQMRAIQMRLAQQQEQREQQKFQMQRDAFDYFGGSSGQGGGAQETSGTLGIQRAPNAQAMPEATKLDQLRRAAIAGVPGAKELFEIHKYENDPRKLEAGSTYEDRRTGESRYMPKLDNGITMGPNGVAAPVAGYAQSTAAIQGAVTGAQEQAKASYDPLSPSFVGADGTPIGGTRAAYVGAPQPAQGGGFLSKLTPQQREYLRKTEPEAYANGLENFNAAQGQRGAPQLQSETQRKEALGRVDLSQGAAGDLNKNWVTTSFNPVKLAGDSARDMQGHLETLRNINLSTGWGTEAKALAANVLVGLGVGDVNAKMFASNAQKFQSVALERMATDLRKNTGPQTEGDAARSMATFVQLKNTPEANTYIMDLARAKANEDQRKAQFYQEALPLATRSGDLTEIDRRWAKLARSIWDDPVMQRYNKAGK